VWTLNSGEQMWVPDYFKYETLDDGSTELLDPSGAQVVGVKEASAPYFSQTFWIYQGLPSIPEEIQTADLWKNIYGVPIHPWNLNLSDEADFQRFVSGIKNLYEHTDYAIALTIHCQIFEMAQYIRGMEQFFIDMYLDEQGARRLLDKLLESYMPLLEKVCAGVGNYVETLRFVDDLGSQQAPLINPEKYRTLIKPYHHEMWQYVHDHSRCKVLLHSCGSIAEYIPDLIEAGVDALNPVQTSSAGMDPRKLKKEFGRDIVFWGGGCDTQKVLPYWTPEQVKQHVREQLEILGEGGGMIFSQIHNIQADVPESNIVAMLDAAHEYGNQ